MEFKTSPWGLYVCMCMCVCNIKFIYNSGWVPLKSTILSSLFFPFFTSLNNFFPLLLLFLFSSLPNYHFIFPVYFYLEKDWPSILFSWELVLELKHEIKEYKESCYSLLQIQFCWPKSIVWITAIPLILAVIDNKGDGNN